jgi:hypothetical protein
MSSTTPAASRKPAPPSTFTLPLPYTLFFLTIEPLSTLTGAFYAWYRQHYYLALTHAASTPPAAAIPLSTSIVLSQLANLYLLLSLNEALVLRTTSDLRVWRTFLFGLLVADFGHVWTVREAIGWSGYVRVWEWNAIDWGNLGFVYVAAAMRVAFLMGVGMGPKKGGKGEEVKEKA